TKVTVGKAERNTITIPKLSLPLKNWRRITGLTVGLSGIGVTIASIGLGYYAYRKYENEFDSGHCSRDTLACTADAVRATNNARNIGTIATVVGIVGVVAAAGGAVFYFTAPKKISVVEKNVISLAPTVTPDGAGVVAFGSF